MEDPGEHTSVLQSWLGELQTAEPARVDEVRASVINHASRRLESLVRKMLKNYPRLRRWEQTGDVLQNALLRLHRSLLTIRPGGVRQFYGLATEQIRRELIDLSRHHFGPQGAAARHHTDGVDAAKFAGTSVERLPDSQSEPSSLLEWTAFHEAVQRLPQGEREVFDLYWYQGLDQKSVASLLNVTDRTVKNRWRTAKLLIRDMMTGDRE